MVQGAVDELLLEVLEHLPQTVRGFKGEMKACSAVFEPESIIPNKRFDRLVFNWHWWGMTSLQSDHSVRLTQ